MGIFDRIAEKAKQAAGDVKQLADKAADEGKNLYGKAAAEGKNLYDKAAAEGKNLYGKAGASTAELSNWASGMPERLRKMADDFDADALWEKLAKTASKAGQELIVMVLTIYYAIESKIPGIKKQNNDTTE